MEELDKDKLKRLSPEERIKHLRRLEDERKKDLDEAERLIRESIEELRVSEEEEEPPEPEPRRESVFEESELEEQIANEEHRHPEAEEEQNVEYAVNLYSELAEVAHADNPYQMISRAREINDRLGELAQYNSQDQRMKKIAEGSRRIMEELFGEYRANLEYRP